MNEFYSYLRGRASQTDSHETQPQPPSHSKGAAGNEKSYDYNVIYND